ncbi:MAG: SRPBCC family protein [Alphaproteobacteria bacterium]|nr:SRPBCC family protein [Alphaproteobacteria bacterium]
MLKRISVITVALLIAFAAYVAMLPAQFTVARSTTIAAPPEVVFPHVNNLKKWDAWSPWAKRDPNMTMIYDGPEAGIGQSGKWSGNEEVGEGKMTITDSTPHQNIKLNLEFIKPFEGNSDVEFRFEPVGEGTKVTWSLDGDQGFFERGLMLLLGMDMAQMIGDDYDKGLAKLKKVVEAG